MGFGEGFRPVKTWDDFFDRVKEPRNTSLLVIFGVIWALCGFNPWVGFGLGCGYLGKLGVIGRKRKLYEEFEAMQHEIELRKGLSTGVPTFPNTPSPVSEQQSTPALHKSIIDDAQDELLSLKSAANTADGQLGINLRSMVMNSEKIQRDLLDDPSKLSQVQRLFVYYLPSVSDLLNARGKAVSNGDTTKIGEIDAMFDRLATAFNDFALRMHGEDARSVDIDLKLLDQSLAQDLGLEPRPIANPALRNIKDKA